MPRTNAGRVLTEQHRRSQLHVRARALRDYMRLWPMWEGDDESFAQMAGASVVLIRAYHGLSASVAASYFQGFRIAEGVPGEAVTKLAGPINESSVVAGLNTTGREAVRDALHAGRSAEDARAAALVRTAGSVTRQVLGGGRETLLSSVGEDDEALGWERVTAGNPCAFCALLASRGPVFREDTADFQAHDSCGCSVAPFYRGAEWSDQAREFQDLYNEAVLEARQDDDLRRGTSNDLLNAFRRRLNKQSGTSRA